MSVYFRHEENYSSTRRCALQSYLRELVRIPQLRRKSNVLKYFLNFNFIEECVDADYDDYYEEERRKQFNEHKETFTSNSSRPSEDRESGGSWGDRSPRSDDEYDPALASEPMTSPTSLTSGSDDAGVDFEVRVSTEGEVFLKGNHSQEDLADQDYAAGILTDVEGVDENGEITNRLDRSASLNSEDSQFEYDGSSGGIRTTNEYNSRDSDDEEGYVEDPHSNAMEVEEESPPQIVAKSPSRMLPEELHNYSLTI